MAQKGLDIGLREEDLVLHLGRRELELLYLRRQVKVLEDRVDELETDEPIVPEVME